LLVEGRRPLPPQRSVATLRDSSTLQDSLMARLDRLAPVKEIAQSGRDRREFSFSLLREVVKRDDVALQSALAQLEDAELLFRTGTAPDARYSFKHALVQDTAYESLLKSRRQVIHQHIAEILRDKFPTVAAAEPELVAITLPTLGSTSRRSSGGERVTLRCAGRPSKKQSPISPRPSRWRTRMPHDRPRVTSRARNACDSRLPTAKRCFGRMGMQHSVPSLRSRAPANSRVGWRMQSTAFGLYGLWVGSYTRGEIGPAREMAELFLREIELQPSLPQACVGHRIFGTTCWYLGDFAGAHHHLEKALPSMTGLRMAISLIALGKISPCRRNTSML